MKSHWLFFLLCRKAYMQRKPNNFAIIDVAAAPAPDFVLWTIALRALAPSVDLRESDIGFARL